MAKRGRSTVLPKPVLFLLAAGALVTIVMLLVSGGDAAGEAADRAAVAASGLAATQPREAALLSLASYRLDPSIAGEFAMLNAAADEGGVERVIDTGHREATAALRTERLTLVATGDGMLGVWRSSDGAPLGTIRTGQPIVAMAESERTRLVATVDDVGEVGLLDLSDPRGPRFHRLHSPARPERMLGLSFSSEATSIYTLSASGEVERLGVATGRRSARFSLRDAGGQLPWADEPSTLRLSAATFDIEEYSDTEPVVVATGDGAVARVDLKARQGETLMRAGIAPGPVTEIAVEPYEGPHVALATASGLVDLDTRQDDPQVELGEAVTGVAFDYGNHLWHGSALGVVASPSYSGWSEQPPAGGPVDSILAAPAGPVAIYPHGFVALLGRLDAGLALPDVSTTTLAAFGSQGELLTSEGYDANHIEHLWTRRPGHALVKGELVHSPKLRSYEPDPDWWPDAEEGSGLYVNDGAIDDEFVAIGGQDPTGEAVVLVWDRRSAQPLRRLALDIGEVEGAPSIVTGVLLLPGKHLLAAYSTVQQLVAIWSTDTWRQVAAVPVGEVGDLSLSPDEETILATHTAGEEAEPPGSGAKLVFVDSDAGRVRDEVAAPGLIRAAWSPDGSRIATLDEDGRFGLRSADGEPERGSTVQFDRQPTALAWRPDGRTVAVGLESGGIAMVDVARSAATSELPAGGALTPLSLSWSPDGRFLAAVTATEDEPPDPGPARIWTLDAPRLERRMCQLAGGPLASAVWRQVAGDEVSPRPLCPRPRQIWQGGAAAASRLAAPAIAYRSDSGFFAADWAGRKAWIGSVDPESIYSPTIRWSGEAMAWETEGRLDVLLPGGSRSRWWACPCEGFGWRGREVVALEAEGRALLEFRPGQARPRRRSLNAPVGSYPRLIGVLGEKAVLAGYLGEPTRATPNALYLATPAGEVRRVPGTVPGIVGPPSVSDPAAGKLAFVASLSGGACYTRSKIGVLALDRGGRPRVEYPKMPGEERYEIVRSLQVAPDGAVGATIAPIGCSDEGGFEREPDGKRYLLRGGAWVATDERGGDIQESNAGLAILDPAPDSTEGAPLRLRPGDGAPFVLAPDVDEMTVRP